MSQNERSVLALNFGSATLKVASFSLLSSAGTSQAAVTRTALVSVETSHDKQAAFEDEADNLLEVISQRLIEMPDAPDFIVHRIVHGGDRSEPIWLTEETLAELDTYSTLAPLHQPMAIALIRASSKRWSNSQQLGVFDTSWHQTMPERHRLLPLPYSLFAQGVKRYGFHGLAFQSAMRQLEAIAPQLSKRRLVFAHLGGGSSLCAVLDGRCVNTTMGMTPLGGIAMATRSGSLDPGVLLHLQRSFGKSADEIDHLLWRESGLKGLSEESGDMRKLLASNSAGAHRAINFYVAEVVQAIAAMAACVGGIDALVFSGGIGKHAGPVRQRIADELAWIGIKFDPALNQAAIGDISSADAIVKTYVLSVDEEEEMVFAVGALHKERM